MNNEQITKKKICALCILSFLILTSLAAENFTFKADKMSGGSASGREITILTGNAEVKSDTVFLQADKIELQGDEYQFIDCVGNVWGQDLERGIVFITDRLRYDRTLKIARLEGDSTMEDKENEVVAKARFIEYNDSSGAAILQVSVRLFKDTMVCRSDYAVYRREDEVLDLSGYPVVYKDSDEFRADFIQVDLETEDVTMEGAISGSIKE
ncbi:MAG: LptA/OstA family protein [Treponema sp.]|nr:LptA/OstA family protein [Treponema sp.]